MPHTPSRPASFFMTDAARGTTPAHIAALPADTGVIFRDYHHEARAALGRAYQEACQQRGLLFLVADDAALATALNADGLHLPEHRLTSLKEVRFKEGLLSAACHSRDAVLKAARYGADIAILSPIFPTESHPNATPIGIEGLRATLDASPIPIYALGGINDDRIKQLPTHPRLAGVAAIGMFMDKTKT